MVKLYNAEQEIKTINTNICNNLESLCELKRGLVSQNILSQLRNFVEAISVFYYCNDIGVNKDFAYEPIKESLAYIRGCSTLNFLYKFHHSLQITTSHYTQTEDESESLMLKYYEYLVRIKKLLLETNNIKVLENLSRFPLDIDPGYKEYYEKILVKLGEYDLYSYTQGKDYKRCYIQKKTPIVIGESIIYEMVLTPATDHVSKFDRIIAFTKFDILTNYSIKVDIIRTKINVIGKNMPISLIVAWESSIRPCELKNFSKIFGDEINLKSSHIEYKMIMNMITLNGLDLLSLILLPDYKFEKLIGPIENEASERFIPILRKCRYFITNKHAGSNILRYLLYIMNNSVIKNQLGDINMKLSNLHLSYGCLTFENTPFSSSLMRHNPRIYDLLNCLDFKLHISEFLARKIKNNAERERILYTKMEDVNGFNDIRKLILDYNSKLYYKHENRKICIYKNFLYIDEYESDVKRIIEKMILLTSKGIPGYKESVEYWLKNEGSNEVDDTSKKDILLKLFKCSSVGLIYGAAGTGKTTLIKHISSYYINKRKLYLANTNPAVDNLKQRINYSNCEFLTVNKAKKKSRECDILFIDECSTISNRDMVEILDKIRFDLLVLVGDIYQIESINYGNWFEIVKFFIPKTSLFELSIPYRTSLPNLVDFWDSVRNLKDDCMDKMIAFNFTSPLNESMFEKEWSDEIILCLNYDGLYGVNNVNKFLQNNNPNDEYNIGLNTFKIDDPILFNDSNRFSPYIYNNMKGTIYNIREEKEQIYFQIMLNKSFSEYDLEGCTDILFIKNDLATKKTVIEFPVKKEIDSDLDTKVNEEVLPFQLAYAVSIHKAQGLEYDSVKIIVTGDSEERISHNIFYTAITRAKKCLKIYWTPETMNKVFKGFKRNDRFKDASIFANKYKFNIKKK